MLPTSLLNNLCRRVYVLQCACLYHAIFIILSCVMPYYVVTLSSSIIRFLPRYDKIAGISLSTRFSEPSHSLMFMWFKEEVGRIGYTSASGAYRRRTFSVACIFRFSWNACGFGRLPFYSSWPIIVFLWSNGSWLTNPLQVAGSRFYF